MAWVSMLPGNLKERLGDYVKGWEGPEKVEGFEGKDGAVKRVRSIWTRPDGKRRRVELSFLAGGRFKITYTPIS